MPYKVENITVKVINEGHGVQISYDWPAIMHTSEALQLFTAEKLHLLDPLLNTMKTNIYYLKNQNSNSVPRGYLSFKFY